MTYQELFKDFYAPNPLSQILANVKCGKFLRDCAKQFKAIDMLMIAWDYETGGSSFIHPDAFIEHCKKQGFPTWQDLEKFGVAVQDTTWQPQRFVDSIDVPWPEGIEIDWESSTKVWQKIVATGFPIPRMEIHLEADIEHGIVSDADLFRIIHANPSDKYRYIDWRRNCNDFSKRLFQGWLAQKGYGNLTIGWLTATFTRSNGTKFHHSVCWALTKEGNLWVFEPQNDATFWRWGDGFNWPGMIDIKPTSMGN